MVKGTTSTGFKFSFDKARLDDMRLIEAFSDSVDESIDNIQRLKASKQILERLLGHEQKEKLYNHIEGYSDGLIPSGALAKELNDILAAVPGNTVKN